MTRRELIALLGSTAAAWPLGARAQQPERMRHIGVHSPLAANDLIGQGGITAFLEELQQSGWIDGRNVRIDYRWSTGDDARIRKDAAELVALAPDLILATGSATVGALLQATRTIPVVFPIVIDPVGAGFVESLARPGGNATGFLSYEYGISGKWLELLKETAPSVTRVAVIRDPNLPSGGAQVGVVQATAPSLRVEIIPLNMRDPSVIERAVTSFALTANGGLIVTSSPLAQFNRDLIVTLAARHNLPAVYPERDFVA